MLMLVVVLRHIGYIKRYKYEEIIKLLELEYNQDINEVYKFLINCEYKIKKEEKILIINNNKEIQLNQKLLKNEEVIMILIFFHLLINKSSTYC